MTTIESTTTTIELPASGFEFDEAQPAAACSSRATAA